MKITYENPEVVGVTWDKIKPGAVASIVNGDKLSVYIKAHNGAGTRLSNGDFFAVGTLDGYKFIVHPNAEVIIK